MRRDDEAGRHADAFDARQLGQLRAFSTGYRALRAVELLKTQNVIRHREKPIAAPPRRLQRPRRQPLGRLRPTGDPWYVWLNSRSRLSALSQIRKTRRALPERNSSRASASRPSASRPASAFCGKIIG